VNGRTNPKHVFPSYLPTQPGLAWVADGKQLLFYFLNLPLDGTHHMHTSNKKRRNSASRCPSDWRLKTPQNPNTGIYLPIFANR